MNKAELVKELESRLGSRKAANDALTHVVDVIILGLQQKRRWSLLRHRDVWI